MNCPQKVIIVFIFQLALLFSTNFLLFSTCFSFPSNLAFFAPNEQITSQSIFTFMKTVKITILDISRNPGWNQDFPNAGIFFTNSWAHWPRSCDLFFLKNSQDQHLEHVPNPGWNQDFPNAGNYCHFLANYWYYWSRACNMCF